MRNFINTAIVVLVGSLIVTSLYALAFNVHRSLPNENKSRGWLEIAPDRIRHSYYLVSDKRSKGSQVLTLRNAGDEARKLSLSAMTCACIEASLDNNALKLHDTIDFPSFTSKKLEFSVEVPTSPSRASHHLTFLDPDSPDMRPSVVGVSLEVVDDLTISPRIGQFHPKDEETRASTFSVFHAWRGSPCQIKVVRMPNNFSLDEMRLVNRNQTRGDVIVDVWSLEITTKTKMKSDDPNVLGEFTIAVTDERGELITRVAAVASN